MHVASQRLSVVVMFNHGSNAHAATVALLEAALGFQPDQPAPCPPDWAGLWLDDRHGLLLRLTPGPDGLALDYGSASATLVAGPQGTAQGDGITLRRLGDDLWMQRAEENLTLTARQLAPVEQADGAAIAGTYWSDEVGATVEITARDGAVFAGFDGLLGRGPVERMYPVTADIWVITTRRAMDAPAPGDWTAQVRARMAQ